MIWTWTEVPWELWTTYCFAVYVVGRFLIKYTLDKISRRMYGNKHRPHTKGDTHT